MPQRQDEAFVFQAVEVEKEPQLTARRKPSKH